MRHTRSLKFLLLAGTAVGVLLLATTVFARHGELPNRIPEPAPYDVSEAQFFPPPWESEWTGVDAPSGCGCHDRIFSEWNGSMMSNSWRDPAWRGAFLLVARLTATDGNCDIPNPPDGTAKAQINPFANGDCTSTFNLGTSSHTTSGSGSLADDFCSRCHMPTNYVDNIPLAGVGPDSPSGLENGAVDPNFDPTSDDGTGLAFATLASQFRNTESGQQGIFCEVCHTNTGSRYTPFHDYAQSGTGYVPVPGTAKRDALLTPSEQDMLSVADPTSPNLGYAVGAGSYRLSPHALVTPERFGPLSWNDWTTMTDPYVSGVFGFPFPYQQGEFAGKHQGFYSAFFERAEMCAACHDVTNGFTIKNQLGNWVGGFPIERTYTEWRNSRYADRPGNPNYDPAYKRDCMTCHMQQDFGQPGTAQTLYENGQPVAPLTGNACQSGPVRSIYYSHHFVGGNAFVPRLLGEDIAGNGSVQPYPELSVYSYSSADPSSPYHHAYFENVTNTGPRTQHDRLAWDRLRNVLTLSVSGPASADPGTSQPLSISVANTGSGHDFPSGFPEGRNAWVAVRAWDVGTGAQLDIYDSVWNRTSTGIGYFTTADQTDPNYPGCNWVLPAGSADPYAYQIKAVASLGDGCPTLMLPYATPLNLVTDANGLPIDSSGTVIDRANPLGVPQYADLDGDGDIYDDAYLVDTRLRPEPHPEASVQLNRYSVVLPADVVGPVAVTAAVYYQSVEGPVAREFLGNLADRDLDTALEPCILGGLCDGRVPSTEPAVVEGAPPVPMEVGSWVIEVNGHTDTTAPTVVSTYPADGATDVYLDAVVKLQLSEPATGIDASSFTLTDSGGVPVPAYVDQLSDGTWALFPHDVFLTGRETYTARLAAPVCDAAGNCTMTDDVWTFTTTRTVDGGSGDTSWPLGFGSGTGGGDPVPYVMAIDPLDGAGGVAITTNVVATFSEPVTNVDASTFVVYAAGGNGKSCSQMGAAVAGTFSSNPDGSVWTFDPNANLTTKQLYCVSISTGVMDLSGQMMAAPFASSFKTAAH